jgi:hypothetical protein
MENEAIADEILSALQQLMEAAGPEWVLEFLNAGIEQAGQGGEQPPEVMPQSGPAAMPPAGRTVGKPRMM